MDKYNHVHIAGVFEERNLENPSTPLDDDAGLNVETSNITVTEATAQTFPPWWQALNVLSGDVAQLPLVTYRRIKGGGKERATDHPTYRLLHRRPNPDLGPFQLKQLNTLRMLVRGNSYSFIERAGNKVIAIWPLEPGTVQPVRESGRLKYVYRPGGGGQETLEAFEMLHLRGPGDSDMQGQSVFKIAKESLTGGMQAQRYGSRFFANDARPGITLEFPDPVDKDTARNILKHWGKRHGGVNNAGRPALLDRGGKVSAFSMTNEDAQFLASREFSRSEVASWFNLPPHKVGDLTHATFSNIEQQSIDYVVYSLMPWLIRWQDECNAKLFSTAEIESGDLFCEFLVTALLRGDYNSRMDGHTKAFLSGILSIDEIRSIENLNPLPDGKGSTHYVPMNMMEVGQAPQPPADTQPTQTNSDNTLKQVLSMSLLNEISRAYQRVGKSATRAAASPGRLQAWIDGTLSKECDDLEAKLEPLLRAGVVDLQADHFADSMRSDFLCVVNDEIEVDDELLKSRIDGRTRRLSSDRPSELVSIIWSETNGTENNPSE